MLKKNLMLLLTISLVLVLAACGAAKSSTSGSDAANQNTNTSSSADKNQTTASGEPRIASMSIHLTNDLLSLGIPRSAPLLAAKQRGSCPMSLTA